MGGRLSEWRGTVRSSVRAGWHEEMADSTMAPPLPSVADLAESDVETTPALHIAPVSLRSSWPMPISSAHRAPPEPLRSSLPARRQYYARTLQHQQPAEPTPPLESALATLSDQQNRCSSMQAQLLLLGAGAAAEAKARNRELVSRNQQLVQQQQRLETENAAVRELKNRAVVLSSEIGSARSSVWSTPFALWA